MPVSFVQNGQEIRHTDEMQDIITKAPSWIMRFGIILFFFIMIAIVGISAVVRYPDVVKATMKVNSPNAAKPVVAKISGKLIKLLVQQNDEVTAGQALGFIESTANHEQVLNLLKKLSELQIRVQGNHPELISSLDHNDIVELGELQTSYQNFYQDYLVYKSSVPDGFYVKKRAYLVKDLADLSKQEQELGAQKMIQQRDFTLAEQEFHIYEKLVQQKAGTPSELRNVESKYLTKKSLMVQTDASLVSANTNYLAKQKEILELDNQIDQERLKFIQSLNSLVSQIQDWKSKYVLTALQSGRLTFAGVIQENDVLSSNEEIFYINPGNEQFFGEMMIPQNSMGKVKEGQPVLIKLRSYPFEEYGMLRGTIRYISDIPYRDSVFLSKVDFKVSTRSDMRRPIHLKQGMVADAEIVTQDATILQRICRNILKVIDKK
ncbi:HlyD family secretion protein [Mucilaginibacter sp. BT774]|uniref:HlyD family secretion protein n=1 Tax=Mucilaginibacter sp. BT774 TaxID=3062276 RepID=UPI002674D29B|nr:HlyD family efflux transporter periplasmic adaptor subunit [Mucilaginibacter sp. BT774]MDO3627173.1 HlyD family efflux transporter periplasmic adaptor subunit [Mucilaginibacter sp. BT774]